jgi:ribosomal protein S18 acetylase RimI-like enzyme
VTTIRPAEVADFETIVEFNFKLAAESEQKALSLDTLRAGVHALLSDPQRGRYFVAVVDQRIVGQIMITVEWSDWRNGELWWLQSVYIDPDYRRRGICRALHQHVWELAQRTPGVVGIRLYVEENNHAAHRTYESVGLKRAGYFVMEQLL